MADITGHKVLLGPDVHFVAYIEIIVRFNDRLPGIHTVPCVKKECGMP